MFGSAGGNGWLIGSLALKASAVDCVDRQAADSYNDRPTASSQAADTEVTGVVQTDVLGANVGRALNLGQDAVVRQGASNGFEGEGCTRVPATTREMLVDSDEVGGVGQQSVPAITAGGAWK